MKISPINRLIELLALDLECYYQQDRLYDFKDKFIRINLYMLKLELVIGRYDLMLERIKIIGKFLLEGGIINSNVYKIETELNFLKLSNPELFSIQQDIQIPIYNAGD